MVQLAGPGAPATKFFRSCRRPKTARRGLPASHCPCAARQCALQNKRGAGRPFVGQRIGSFSAHPALFARLPAWNYPYPKRPPPNAPPGVPYPGRELGHSRLVPSNNVGGWRRRQWAWTRWWRRAPRRRKAALPGLGAPSADLFRGYLC